MQTFASDLDLINDVIRSKFCLYCIAIFDEE